MAPPLPFIGIKDSDEHSELFNSVLDFLFRTTIALRNSVRNETIAPPRSLLYYARHFWDEDGLDDYTRGVLMAVFALLATSHQDAIKAVEDIKKLSDWNQRVTTEFGEPDGGSTTPPPATGNSTVH